MEVEVAGKKDFTFPLLIVDDSDEVVCELEKVVYVRKKGR